MKRLLPCCRRPARSVAKRPDSLFVDSAAGSSLRTVHLQPIYLSNEDFIATSLSAVRSVAKLAHPEASEAKLEV
jgi:hypothetical protein